MESIYSTDLMYSVNNSGSTVQVVDVGAQSVVATVPVGQSPYAIALAGTAMYVTNAGFGVNSVNIVDINTNTVAGTVSVGASPICVARTATGMYVGNLNSDNVNIIDLSTQLVSGTVPTSSPRALALAGTGMYVANYNTHSVSIIDVTTATVVNTVNVNSAPIAMALAGTGMYVAHDDYLSYINIIDVDTQLVSGTVAVLGTRPRALALAGTGMYVGNENSDDVMVIDTTTQTFVNTIPGINDPWALALSGTAGMMCVGTLNSGFQIIDINTNTVVGTVPGIVNSIALAAVSVPSPPPPPPPPAPSVIPIGGLSGDTKKIADFINAQNDPNLLHWFEGLSSEETAQALNAICGSRNHAAFFESEFVLQTAVRSLASHLRTTQSFVNKPQPMTAWVASAEDTVPACQERKEPWMSAWVSNTAQYAHLKQSVDNNPSLGFFSDTTLVGFDYQTMDRRLVGGTLGYSHIHNHQGDNGGHQNSNLYMGGVYADLFFFDHFYVSPALLGAFDATQSRRNVKFTGFDAKASSSLFAWLLDPHLELGYEIVQDATRIIPFSALDWTFTWQRGYKERGASPWNESAPAQKGSLLRSETGLRLSQDVCFGWGELIFLEKASYVLEKPFSAGNIQTGFVGIPGSFSVTYADHLLNLGALGLDIAAHIGKKKPTVVRLGFEGEAGSRYFSAEATLELAQKF